MFIDHTQFTGFFHHQKRQLPLADNYYHYKHAVLEQLSSAQNIK